MENKCLSRRILLSKFFVSHTYSNAQFANSEHQKGKQIEIENLKRMWSSQLPFDSKFGIISSTKALDIDHPGLEKVKQLVLSEEWDIAKE